MLSLCLSKQFGKDVELLKQRRVDCQPLKDIISLITSGATIPKELKPHPLKNDKLKRWDLHIASDWVLLYKIQGETLYLYRTGRHADVFTKN